MNQLSRSAPICVRSVPAGRGFFWWSAGFTWLFGNLSNLLTWVAMGLCLVVATALPHLFPVVGSIASTLLWFVLSGGLMNAAHKTAQGQPAAFSDLFSGFGSCFGALVGVGLIALIVSAVIVGVMLVVGFGGTLAELGVAWAHFGLAMDPTVAMTRIGGTTILILLLCTCLFIPLSMAIWLAPALVVLRGANPLDALGLSLKASWRSAGALTLYGIAFFFMSVASTIVMMIGWIFLLPLLFLTTYAAYQDLFDAAVEVLDADPVARA